MPGSPNGGVKYHAMVTGSAVPASAFMHSMAGQSVQGVQAVQGVQGVPTSMMTGSLHTPISPVGALTAQLNDLSPGHASWLYNQALHGGHGISPPQSPSENALAFSSGNGAYAGYPFGQPVAQRVQAQNMKGARLSIGSSNDEEDADIEPRSGKLVYQTSQPQPQPPPQNQSQSQPQNQTHQPTHEPTHQPSLPSHATHTPRVAPAVPRVSRDPRDPNPNVRSDNSDSDHRPSTQAPKEQTSPKDGPRDTRTARIQSEQVSARRERAWMLIPATPQRAARRVRALAQGTPGHVPALLQDGPARACRDAHRGGEGEVREPHPPASSPPGAAPALDCVSWGGVVA